MSIFSYKAIDETGIEVKGVIEAETAEQAGSILAAKGYIPSRIAAEKTKTKGSAGKGGRIQISDIILFTKQFRTMMLAGVPIIRLLQVLEVQTQNRKLRQIIARISEDIKQGLTLTDAMEKHEKTFSPLYISMIRAGEISGTIPEILDRLVAIIEHEHKIKSDIKAALQYPIIVIIALGIAFFILLTFVIPKFAAIFKTAGIPLPLPTKIAIGMYQFLFNYWYLLIGGLILAIVSLVLYVRTSQGRYVWHAFLLKIPLLGPLFLKAAMSRFASIFAILQASGVNVMTTMEILTGTIGNDAIAREFQKVQQRIEEGHGISAPLKSAKYFTPMVIDMVAIGEESGNMEDMLRSVSTHYDEEVAYAVKALSDAIGPILTVGLAVVVLFFALAIFMPMWDLTKMVRPK